MRWWCLALLLIACGERRDVVAVEPVVEPVVEPGADPLGATSDATPEPPPEDRGGLEVEARSLAGTDDREAFPFEVPRHPNATAGARLEGFLVALATEAQASRYDDGSCRLLLARVDLVTVVCRGTYTMRGGRAIDVRSTHFAIRGDDVEPFEVADAFVRGADFGPEMVRRCEAALEASMPGEVGCYGPPPLALGPRGLVGQEVFGTLNPTLVPLEIPYDTLRDQVRPGGPLAAMLRVEGEAAAGVPTGAFALTPTLLRDEAVAAFASFPVPTPRSAGLRLQTFGPSLARVVSTSGGRELADRLATAAGFEARPLSRLDSDSLHPVQWARAREAVKLHAGGRDRWILPEGSLVVVVGALAGAHEYVLARSALASGQVEDSFLEAYRGCIPSPPEAAGATPPSIVSTARARVDDRERDVAVFAWTDADGSRVAIHDLRAADCTVGAQRGGFSTSAGLFHLELQPATEGGGPTLVVVGSGGEGDSLRYQVRELGASRDAWRLDFEHPVGVGYMVWLGFRWRRGGWLPVSYQTDGGRGFRGLRWADGTLEEVGAVDQ